MRRPQLVCNNGMAGRGSAGKDGTMQPPPKPDQPILLYDGECPFCAASVGRWSAAGEGRVELAPSQSGAGEPYGFPAGSKLGAVRLIERDGSVRSGAAAALRLMELCGSPLGGFLRKLHAGLPPARWIMDLGYRLIAANRGFLSKFRR